MNPSAIELVNLSKTYQSGWKKNNEALRDLTLAIEPGEVFGFVGPNGAGKSTTIKIIMGLLKASGGEAKLFGLPVDDPQSRTGVAYVPESPLLYDYLTPLEILQAGCQFHQLHLADLKKHCMGWLERFGIDHVAGKPIKGFSKGMTQRTALAHALALQPKLLILDEPLSGLDPLGRKTVVDILADYRAQGGTIFFSSHVLYDVERLADRYGLIHQGILRTVRNPAELLGDEARVLVTSHGETEVSGMTHLGLQRWQAEVPRAEVWQLLQTLQAAGHSLHEVRSTTTLEQAFLEWVQPADKAQA